MENARSLDKEIPLVSIVTPSYNCGRYIGETIQSVLEQDYPRIEHIIVDGASQDNTIEILKKYNGKIKWISEPDNGMYNAINKGIGMASGEIFTYINADDLYYAKDTVSSVVKELLETDSADFTFGHCAFTDAEGHIMYIYKAPPFNRRIALAFPRIIFHQPTCFWRRSVHMDFDESFRHCGDSHFFRYLCKEHLGKNTGHIIAKFRVREDCLSFSHRERMSKEDERVFGKQRERRIPIYLRIFDLVYIRTFLNLKANLKRFILHCQKRPYL